MKLNGNMRVKVSVEKLRERIEAKQADDDRTYEDLAASYEERIDDWRRDVFKAITEAAQEVDNLEYSESFRSRRRNGEYVTVVEIEVPAEHPEKPVKSDHSEALGLLDLVADDTILVTVNSPFARYL